MPDDEDGHDINPADHLWGAVRTIIADFVMSLDNVVGVAGAAQGELFLLLFGLALSIPLIVWSSQLILLDGALAGDCGFWWRFTRLCWRRHGLE